jgi:hypothetical protein
MNIYKISQDEQSGMDTYSACVVYAKSRKQAQQMRPCGKDSTAWAMKLENVEVEYLGKAQKKSDKSYDKDGGFILESFIGY